VPGRREKQKAAVSQRNPGRHKRQRKEAGKPDKSKTQSGEPRRQSRSQKKSGLARVDDGLVFVLSHPLRVRMLSALSAEEGSASDLAERLNTNTWSTSYHMDVLKKYGCVEFVRDEKVRGFIKSIYRAKIEVNFPKEVWEELPPSVQQMVVAAVFMTSFSDAETALMSRAYEQRPESHASWSNLEVDEQGWLEIVKTMNQALEQSQKIEEEAKARLTTSKDDQILTVSLNLSTFVLPEDAQEIESRLSNSRARRRAKETSSLQHGRD
jgi:predicted ArsR family transcriptional regulator